MIKLHIFGSCSGTEPYPDRHHASFAIELNNGIYWLDAGENCSYTAYLMGVDLLKVRNIFISHCHMDHVGGLGNLLWNIRKVSKVQGRPPVQDPIEVYIPYPEVYQAVMQVLAYTEENFRCSYDHRVYPVSDGILYRGQYDPITVEALHNHHLHHEEGTPWRSFAYRFFVEDKSIIYSGDTQLEDIDYVVPEECDVLLMETGHHKAENVCKYLIGHHKKVKQLIFIHHGVEILNSPEEEEKKARKCWDGKLLIAHDAMTVTL